MDASIHAVVNTSGAAGGRVVKFIWVLKLHDNFRDLQCLLIFENSFVSISN